MQVPLYLLKWRKKRNYRFFTLRNNVILGLGLVIGFGLIWAFLLYGDRASANWYHDSWGFRRKITIDNTKVSGSNDLANFPVLVSFTSDSSLSANAKTDGSDILFVDTKGQQLTHEIEYYSAGTLVAWVKIPTLSATVDTVIYMYYGNSSASGLENETAVWSSDYRGVWHLSETSGQHQDSTSNNNDSTAVTVTTQGSATGKIGGADDFASGNEVVVADSDSLDITSSFTAQAWVKADTIGGSGTWNSIIYKGGNSNYFLELTNTDEIDAGFYGGGDWRGVMTTTDAVSTGSFYHLAVVHDAANDTIKTYVNGVEKATVSGITQTPLVNTSTFTIGENFYNETFDGIIDEVRLSDSPKSVDWLLTEYNNQNSPATFYSASHEEVRKRGPSAHWKFDEGYGAVVNDSSGNTVVGSMGTGSSAPTWTAEEGCISGNCIQMDGTDDFLSFGDNLDVEDGQDFTFSAWIKSNSFSTVQTVLAKKLGNSSGQVGYLINIGTGGTLNFYAADGTDQIWKGSSTVMSANSWYHIAFVYDEDNASNIAFYINGTATSGNLTGTLSNINSLANTQVLGLGVEPDGQYVFNGFIDEAKFYSYARTADEIKQDYLFAGAKGSSAVLGTQDSSFMSDGLVGYWKMDETTGSTGPSWTAADSSGNGNNGTGAGNAGPGVGKFGNGGSFDGTGDYVNLGDPSNLNPDTQMTISMWVKLNSLVGYNSLISKRTDPTSQAGDYDLLTHDSLSDKFHFQIHNGTIWKAVTSTTIPTTGNWYHVAVTADESSGEMKMYINGALENTATETIVLADTTSTAKIGDGAGDTSGVIDEVRIFNRTLTSREVKSLYEWSPGPIGYWKMDEGSGATIHDSSGNGNNSSVWSGNTLWVQGKYGSGTSHDGSGDRITIPSSTSLDYQPMYTWSLWLNPTAGSYEIIDKSADTNNGWKIGSNGNKYSLTIFYTGTDLSCSVPASNMLTGEWQHIAWTWDGSSSCSGVKLYKNGQSINYESTTAPSGSRENDTGKNILIGGNGYTDYPGKIDDFKIYNYARTQQQVIQDMNAGHPVIGTPVGSAVLHLSLNEGYGSTAHDISPRGNNGTLGTGSSAPSWTNDGKFGKALTFDGNDYLNISDSDDFTFGNGTADAPFTVSAWVNTSDATQGTIVGKYDDTSGDQKREFLLYLSSSDYLTFQITDETAGGYIARRWATPFPENTWHHVVGVYDGSGIESGIKIYVDGVQKDDTSSSSGSFTAIQNTTSSVEIGAHSNSASGKTYFFDGIIDEVNIYPFGLTSDQIQVVYNGGKTMVLGAKSTGVGGTSPSNSAEREYCVPGDTSTCNAPVAEWKFDEGTGLSAYDTSGNGLTGTLTNGPIWSAGKRGKSIKFDGVNDYVTVPDNDVLDFGTSTPFTVSFWFKMTGSSNADQDFFDKVSGNGFKVEYNGAQQKLQAYIRNSSAGFCTVRSSVDPEDGQWRHASVVFYRNPTCTTNDIHIYLNGQREATSLGLTSAVTNDDVTNTTNLNISDPTDYVEGYMDDIRIYNYARTPAQIAWEYNRGAPVVHYKFDECQGSTVYNSALNGDGKAAGNNGTITIGGSGTSSVGNCSTSSTAWGNGASGKINSSLDFDGTDDYATVADSSELSFGDGSTDKPFSVSAWIKMDDATDFQFVNKLPASGVLSNLEWAFGVGVTDRLGFRLYDNSSLVYIGKYSDSTFTAYEGQWIHVAVTYDGSESASAISLYLNGNEIPGTTESAGSYAGIESTSSDLHLGALLPSDATYKKFANGKIDDLRIYNYELTAAQIRNVMNNGAVSFR